MNVKNNYPASTYSLCQWPFDMCIKILQKSHIPKHIAFIADGNRTFSKKKNISLRNAYLQGVEKVFELIRISGNIGIPILTFYLYSSYNNQRNESDKSQLFEVIQVFLERLSLLDIEFNCHILGNVSPLPEKIHELCAKLTERNNDKTTRIFYIALNYSGKEEMCDLCINQLTNVSKIDDIPSSKFYPDIVIRTSGQKRLSDFLLWQTTLSYLYFTSPCWPEFSRWNLLAAIFMFQHHRRINSK